MDYGFEFNMQISWMFVGERQVLFISSLWF